MKFCIPKTSTLCQFQLSVIASFHDLSSVVLLAHGEISSSVPITDIYDHDGEIVLIHECAINNSSKVLEKLDSGKNDDVEETTFPIGVTNKFDFTEKSIV